MNPLSRRSFVALCVVLVLAVSACSRAGTSEAGRAAVFYNGPILTMEGDVPRYAEAVVVRGGKIAFVGSSKKAFGVAGAGAARRDLHGHTLVPGFIDTWGHFTLLAQDTLAVSLSYFGADPPHTSAQIIQKLQKEGKLRNGWIVGTGYAEALLSDGPPSIEDLDRAFADVPVLLMNISTLTGKVNSAGLRALGITPETKPTGGYVVKDPKTGKLTGDLIGQPFLTAAAQAVGSIPQPLTFETYRKAQSTLAQAGFTTVQTYSATPQQMLDMRAAVEHGIVALDIIALPVFTDVEKLLEGDPSCRFGVYSRGDHGFKVGGMLLPTDGAPQLRLAFLSKPYADTTGFPAGWRGFPYYPQATIDKYVKMAFEHRIQLFAYSNGDAGIDMTLSALDKAAPQDAGVDRRTVIAHSTFVRDDQLARYRKHRIIAAFMPNACWLYGDVYRQYLGPARANAAAPVERVHKAGIVAVLHADYPSSAPDVVATMANAVNRTTISGKVLGPEPRLAPYIALLGVTRQAAFMYHEEKTKGTVAVGKMADLVVLDRNPLTVPPDTLKDIAVLETIKAGRTLYKKP